MQTRVIRPKRKYKKRKIWKSRVYAPSEDQAKRLLLVKNLYDQFKTLEEVAIRLNLTRERVRQLLKKGQQYKLFQYEVTREREFKAVREKISSDALINEIKNQPNRFKRCENLKIGMNDYFKLLKFYQIDTQDYLMSARLKRYLVRYSTIVDRLGHHPSTTEMQSNINWRSTYTAIKRLWGSIDKFRNEFGIEKPPFAIHPNTILAFKKAKEKAKQRKQKNMFLVENLIVANGPISSKDIVMALGFKFSTTSSYIKQLLQKDIIKPVGSITSRKYISNKNTNSVVISD